MTTKILKILAALTLTAFVLCGCGGDQKDSAKDTQKQKQPLKEKALKEKKAQKKEPQKKKPSVDAPPATLEDFFALPNKQGNAAPIFKKAMGRFFEMPRDRAPRRDMEVTPEELAKFKEAAQYIDFSLYPTFIEDVCPLSRMDSQGRRAIRTFTMFVSRQTQQALREMKNLQKDEAEELKTECLSRFQAIGVLGRQMTKNARRTQDESVGYSIMSQALRGMSRLYGDAGDEIRKQQTSNLAKEIREKQSAMTGFRKAFRNNRSMSVPDMLDAIKEATDEKEQLEGLAEIIQAFHSGRATMPPKEAFAGFMQEMKSIFSAPEYAHCMERLAQVADEWQKNPDKFKRGPAPEGKFSKGKGRLNKRKGKLGAGREKQQKPGIRREKPE